LNDRLQIFETRVYSKDWKTQRKILRNIGRFRKLKRNGRKGLRLSKSNPAEGFSSMEGFICWL
jgi:hypothetical protein